MARDIERRKKWRNEWARNGETLSWKDAKDAAVLSARADKVERTIASMAAAHWRKSVSRRGQPFLRFGNRDSVHARLVQTSYASVIYNAMLLRRDVEIILRLNNRIDVRFIFVRGGTIIVTIFFSGIDNIISGCPIFAQREIKRVYIFLARATIQIRLCIVVRFREFLPAKHVMLHENV